MKSVFNAVRRQYGMAWEAGVHAEVDAEEH